MPHAAWPPEVLFASRKINTSGGAGIRRKIREPPSTRVVLQRLLDNSGGATGRTGEDTSPPVLFKVNFLIFPNPVRKMGGGGVRL